MDEITVIPLVGYGSTFIIKIHDELNNNFIKDAVQLINTHTLIGRDCDVDFLFTLKVFYSNIT